jgi:hypothetical protein
MEAESVSSYGSFIQEAFINPIRSVLIIDDEYPTIEQIITSQIKGEEQKVYEKPQQILNVVQGFRNEHPTLIVDIHDGRMDVNEEWANYLHQSDLLILDFELEDDGEKSIEITKKIFSNAHFNLIVVHTNSRPSTPFERNLFALLAPCESLQLEKNKERISRGKDLIGKFEDDDRDIASIVIDSVGFQQYMQFRHPKFSRGLQAVKNGDAPFGDFKAICDKKGWSRSTPSEIFLWALAEYEKANANSFGDGVTVAENWSQVSSDRLWVRTNKGFITFVKKSDEIKLLDELSTSLEDWRPSPSRLLAAKLRAELDDQGVIAEDRVLGSKLLHAKFYNDLYEKTTDESTQVAIDAQIGRHLEDMGNLVRNNVMPFMKRLVEEDQASGGDSDFVNYYGIDVSGEKNKEAINKFNAYISCYPEVSGWHLAPGHILNLNGDKWVCLSPICDLVPGQKTSVGIYGDVGKGKPFLGVKLHKRNGNLDATKINSNNFLFLPNSSDSGEVNKYGFYKGSGTDPNESLSPHWSLFVAENGGQFDPKKRSIRIAKIGFDEQASENSTEEIPGLNFKYHQCEIVAQLRYEYALNLIQKLGAEQTRVGLGYISS